MITVGQDHPTIYITMVIKKNGEGIRLCIDCRRVNQLTRLMVYLMPLVSELLQDMDKAIW